LEPFPDPASRPLGRALDRFIEVQVHCELNLRNDVERLVADPAFRDRPTREVLTAILKTNGVPLSWHPGYRMPGSKVPDTFRDYPVRPLPERIASDGMLDAAHINAAANSVKLKPQAWEGWASDDDVLPSSGGCGMCSF
jgi:hypothetical protein